MPDRESTLPGQSLSYWIDSTEATSYPQLTDDIAVDVAVIGGGIAGISTAAFLQEEGMTVALLEADRVITKVTGHTTAKLTAAHGLIYDHLQSHLGEESARHYADANQDAIQTVAGIVEQDGIDCDFEWAPAYTYGVTADDRTQLRDEVAAAEQAGLPVEYVEDVPLPIDTVGAVKMTEQAHFHPRAYLLHLVEQIPGDGSHVFEETRIRQIRYGDPHHVVADTGTVTADSVVVATHFPLQDPALYFARLYPKYSYVLGTHLEHDSDVPDGMFYSTEESFHSFRPQQTEEGRMLLSGGQPHRTGRGGTTTDRYQALAQYTQNTFDVDRFAYRWSTQDYSTPDRVPYIGPISPFSEDVYVATGFQGWGMTHGTVAGILLTDLIQDRENPWSDLYTPNRLGSASALKPLFTENLENAGKLVKGYLASRETERLPGNGDAKVMKLGGDRIAVYRDDDGELHTYSAVCPHMQCVVSWNDAEQTWDCPCHGSRFTAEGEVIDGPAQTGLEKKDIEESS